MKIADDMLTGWFPHAITPIRIGVYAVEWPLYVGVKRGFAHWNGIAWGNTADRACDAELMAGDRDVAAQNKSWRGLKSPAKEN
jgi:hypothetical protein